MKADTFLMFSPCGEEVLMEIVGFKCHRVECPREKQIQQARTELLLKPMLARCRSRKGKTNAFPRKEAPSA